MNKSASMKGKGHRPQSTTNKGDTKKKDDDSSFVYNLGILIGCVAEIHTKSGEKYEGIFSAFSQSSYEIMIEAAHLLPKDSHIDDENEKIKEHYDLLIVPSDKIVFIRFPNAEVSYACRDFQIDAAIGATRSSITVGDKELRELTPWEGADDSGDGLDLDISSGSTSNGWEAQEMFKKNEEKYGVVSSFKQDLSGYTTQLDKTDDSFRKHEEQASQIADEIEKNTSSWERTQAENGDNEEEAFSAVIRPTRNNSNHSNNNHTSSNTSGGDKYVVPSRRHQPPQQSNVQQQQQQQQQQMSSQQQSHPVNNSGPPPINNNNNANNGNIRKPAYNQNPRGNYGGSSTNSYERQRNYNPRGGGGPQQYPTNHSDGRRPDDGGPRQNRIPNSRAPIDPHRRGGGGGGGGGGRDGDQVNKLKHFGEHFRLQPSESANPPRMRIPPNQSQNPGAPGNTHIHSPGSGSNVPVSSNPIPPGVRNPSPPANIALQSHQISSTQSPPKPTSNKTKEFSPVPPLVQPPSGPASTTNSENSSGSESPRSSSNPTTNASSSSPSPNTPSSVVSQAPSEVITPSTTPGSTTESQSTTVAASSVGDSKGNAESENKSKKIPFTFNPNAKEFNPTAKPFTPQRSPSTPPRPPSTPQTQQLMPQLHSFMSLPMPPQALLYAPPPQYTTHAQAALTPSNNTSVNTVVSTPRHGHRKGTLNPSRPEITQPMPMATGPPLIAPASLQAGAPSPQYYAVPTQGGAFQQVMRVVPQSMMSVYQPEGGGGAQMHQPVHYIHNGAAPPNNPGHQSNTPPSNPNTTSVVQANGHAYGQGQGNHGAQHHMGGYPFVSLPMVGVSYSHGHPPPHMVIPYLSQQQGGANSGIPHSQ